MVVQTQDPLDVEHLGLLTLLLLGRIYGGCLYPWSGHLAQCIPFSPQLLHVNFLGTFLRQPQMGFAPPGLQLVSNTVLSGDAPQYSPSLQSVLNIQTPGTCCTSCTTPLLPSRCSARFQMATAFPHGCKKIPTAWLHSSWPDGS